MQLENRNYLLLSHRPLLGLFFIIFSGLLLTACGIAEELSDTGEPVVPESLMELCPADVRSSIESNEEILSITYRHNGETSNEYLITDAGMIQTYGNWSGKFRKINRCYLIANNKKEEKE